MSLHFFYSIRSTVTLQLSVSFPFQLFLFYFWSVCFCFCVWSFLFLFGLFVFVFEVFFFFLVCLFLCFYVWSVSIFFLVWAQTTSFDFANWDLLDLLSLHVNERASWAAKFWMHREKRKKRKEKLDFQLKKQKLNCSKITKLI